MSGLVRIYKAPRLSRKRIRSLVEEATVDAYGEDEQTGGFLVMITDNLPASFKALVVGEEVEVVGFDGGDAREGIKAICKRRGRRYKVDVLALEWPQPPPKGAEWIEAYRAWVDGGW